MVAAQCGLRACMTGRAETQPSGRCGGLGAGTGTPPHASCLIIASRQPLLIPQTSRRSPTVLGFTQYLRAPCSRDHFAVAVQPLDLHLCPLCWVSSGSLPSRPPSALMPSMGLLHSRGLGKPGWLCEADPIIWG